MLCTIKKISLFIVTTALLTQLQAFDTGWGKYIDHEANNAASGDWDEFDPAVPSAESDHQIIYGDTEMAPPRSRSSLNVSGLNDSNDQYREPLTRSSDKRKKMGHDKPNQKSHQSPKKRRSGEHSVRVYNSKKPHKQ